MQNFILKNNDGSDFNLYENQSGGNLLIVFFRGAWCNHCKKQLSAINQSLTEITALNTKIVAISSDTAFKSSLLKTFLKLNFPVLSDTEFKVIDALNLRTVYKNQEVSKPAIFILTPNHEIFFQYIGQDFDDRMDIKIIINELQKLNK